MIYYIIVYQDKFAHGDKSFKKTGLKLKKYGHLSFNTNITKIV